MKIITFGCRLNTFETALMRRLAADELDDVILFNTCAVTAEAERQCRQSIRKARRDFPKAVIVVAGCSAQLHPEVYAAMPEVDRVLGNHEKLTRAALFATEKVMVGDMADTPPEVPVLSDFEGRTRAFLQIQQGCDHACTFCIVRQARGKNRGLPPEQVIEQAKTFVAQGVAELVLTGVDVASYPGGLVPLASRLAREVKGLKRLRFGSLDPAVLNADFIALFRDEPIVMPHIHLSMQAGNDLILKRMGRRHTTAEVVAFIDALKEVRPELAVGLDLIAGFPTETEAAFQETLAFVERIHATHLHVFPYSARPGTPAAKMPMVNMPVRKERAARLRALGEKQYQAFLESFIGKTVPVLVEEVRNIPLKNGHAVARGLTENYVPVYLTATARAGDIQHITIKGIEDDTLVG